MRLRTILAVAAGLILLLIAAAVVAVKSMDFNKYKGLIAEQVKAATGREFTIAGGLAVELGFSPAVVVEEVALGNAPWGSRPDMVKVRRFELEVALIPLIFREVRVKRLVLVQPDILLETDARGTGNWSMGGAVPSPAPQAAKPGEAKGGLAGLAVERVRIERGTLTYRDGRTGRTASLALDRLDLRARDAGSPLTIDLAAAYKGKAFTLAGTAGPLPALQAPSRPYPVRLALKAGGATLEVDGTIAKPAEVRGIDLTATVESKDPRSAAKAFGADVPPLPPLSVTARLRDLQGAYAFSDLKGSIGKSNLTGRGVLSIGGPRPRIMAQLASTLLDLSELLPREATTKAGAPAARQSQPSGAEKRAFPADPLPLAGLRVADADLDLRADRLVLPNGLPVEALALRLALSGGRLEVKPLSARIGGGAATGQIALHASAGRTATLAARVDAKGIDLGQVLRQMGHSDLVTGTRADLTLNLRGSGGSVRELMAGLDGEGLLVLGEGRIQSSFIEWLGADLLTQIVEKLNPLGKGQPYTELTCGVVQFAAKDGIASTDRGVAFETSKMTLVSSGTVNLKTEAIDFSLRPETRNVVGIGAGGLVKLLRVRGSLMEPKVGIDELETAKTAASIGAAVVTSGLSLLAETLVKRATADAHPCQTALGRSAAAAKTGTRPSTATPTGQASPNQGSGIEQFFKGLFGK